MSDDYTFFEKHSEFDNIFEFSFRRKTKVSYFSYLLLIGLIISILARVLKENLNLCQYFYIVSMQASHLIASFFQVIGILIATSKLMSVNKETLRVFKGLGFQIECSNYFGKSKRKFIDIYSIKDAIIYEVNLFIKHIGPFEIDYKFGLIVDFDKKIFLPFSVFRIIKNFKPKLEELQKILRPARESLPKS